MKAQEARQIAEETKSAGDSVAIKEIQEYIKVEAIKGNLSINCYIPINNEIKIHFENLGYTVHLVNSGPNEQCYKISW